MGVRNFIQLISMESHGCPYLYFDYFLLNSVGVLNCVSIDFYGTPRVSAIVFRLISTGFSDGSTMVFRLVSMEFSGCPQLYFDCFLWNSADVLNYVSIDFYTFPQVSAAVFR